MRLWVLVGSGRLRLNVKLDLNTDINIYRTAIFFSSVCTYYRSVLVMIWILKRHFAAMPMTLLIKAANKVASAH